MLASETRPCEVRWAEPTGEAVGWRSPPVVTDSGATTITVDSFGNPLEVGREKRLFTKRQRVALRIRDGGCLWPGCNAPPSHREAHHSEHWAAHRLCTDIDLGVLMCTFHHLRLHNQGRSRTGGNAAVT